MTIGYETTDNHSVIAVNYPAALLRLSVREGIASADILANTDFTAETLESAKGFVPFAVYEQMIGNAYRHIKKPFLGLLLGADLGLTTHGMLGIAALSSLTYGDAIQLTARFFKCRFPVIECQYKETDDSIVLELQENITITEVKPFLIESIYASLREVSKLLIGDYCEKITFEFDFPEPNYPKHYRQTLGNNLRFNQPVNRMVVPKKIKSFALKMAEPLTRELAEKSCEKVLEHFPQQSSIAEKIRLLLKCDGHELLNFTFPQMEKIAITLNMSPRTLRRRLKLEGTCLQGLVDEIRKKLALRYLTETQLSITQISSQLDFNDASYFSKSFKRWVGVSPKKYRETPLADY